jgi:hypothetical protein
VNVEEESEFSVVRLQDSGVVAADDATWSVEPANAATVNPVSGTNTKVIATIAGPFILVAKDSRQSEPARFPVEALVSQGKAVELPFIGQAYGAIAIAVVVVAAIIVLGLSDILSGEAVATLLGALLGYIFGVTRSDVSSSQPTSK